MCVYYIKYLYNVQIIFKKYQKTSKNTKKAKKEIGYGLGLKDVSQKKCPSTSKKRDRQKPQKGLIPGLSPFWCFLTYYTYIYIILCYSISNTYKYVEIWRYRQNTWNSIKDRKRILIHINYYFIMFVIEVNSYKWLLCVIHFIVKQDLVGDLDLIYSIEYVKEQ